MKYVTLLVAGRLIPLCINVNFICHDFCAGILISLFHTKEVICPQSGSYMQCLIPLYPNVPNPVANVAVRITAKLRLLVIITVPLRFFFVLIFSLVPRILDLVSEVNFITSL